MTATDLPADPPSGRPGHWQGWGAFAKDVGRLLHDVARDPRVPRRAKVVAAAAATYVVVPIDPIPDFVPVIGWVDDIIVAGAALRYLLRHTGYELIRELWRGDDSGFALLLFMAGVER
jgi:uncharacterized membrane protein YkvA (DUF1232 family)